MRDCVTSTSEFKILVVNVRRVIGTEYDHGLR